MSELDQICTVLDKLTLDTLTLMEEEIQLKLNVESAMAGGETHLAKTRYILGQNNVSALQLPTENTSEFSAQVKVMKESEGEEETTRTLELNKEAPNPIKWFGILVPQDLHGAQNLYRQALQWAIQAVNVQNRISDNCTRIYQLNQLKKECTTK